jgi:hypothetical protein
MSLIKQLMQRTADEEALITMIEHVCVESIEYQTKHHAVNLAERMAASAQTKPGEAKVGDIVIKIDPAAIKPFVISTINNDKIVARNPKDGEQVNMNAQQINVGTSSARRSVQQAAQRLMIKYPNRNVWVHGDEKAKADNKTGNVTRAAFPATTPQYDENGNIVFEPQPEFRGKSSKNTDVGAS